MKRNKRSEINYSNDTQKQQIRLQSKKTYDLLDVNF